MFVVKIVTFVWKDKNKSKRGPLKDNDINFIPKQSLDGIRKQGRRMEDVVESTETP